jgi:hypothetical protein
LGLGYHGAPTRRSSRLLATFKNPDPNKKIPTIDLIEDARQPAMVIREPSRGLRVVIREPSRRSARVLVPTVEKGIQRMEAKNRDKGKRPIWQPLWDFKNVLLCMCFGWLKKIREHFGVVSKAKWCPWSSCICAYGATMFVCYFMLLFIVMLETFCCCCCCWLCGLCWFHDVNVVDRIVVHVFGFVGDIG